MGGWFLSIAMANYVAGLLAAEASGNESGDRVAALAQYADVFNSMFIIGIVVAVLFFLAAPLINRLMHGVK
jgi:POT family proton-dependent oligopeptide transporter